MNKRICKSLEILLAVCLVAALVSAPAVSAAEPEVSGETAGEAAMPAKQDAPEAGEPEAEDAAPAPIALSADAGEFLAWLGNDGDPTTFTLTGDIEVTAQDDPIRVKGNKTLDLAGHKITFAEHTGRWLELDEGASLTVYGNKEDTAQAKPETANIIFPVINNDKDGIANYEVIYAENNTNLNFNGVYIHVQNAHGPAKAVSTEGDLTAMNSVFELDAGTCALCMDNSSPKAPCKDNPYNAVYGKGGSLTLTDSDAKVRVLQEATEKRPGEDAIGDAKKAVYCHTLTRALESEGANVSVTGGSLIIDDDPPKEDELTAFSSNNQLGASSLYVAGTGSETVTLKGTKISFDPYHRTWAFNYGLYCEKVQVELNNIDFQMGTKEVVIGGITYCYLSCNSTYTTYGLHLKNCGKVDIRNIADGHFKVYTSGGGDTIGVYMNGCQEVAINGFGEKDGEDDPSLAAKKDTVSKSSELVGAGLIMFQFTETHVKEMKNVYFIANAENVKKAYSSTHAVLGIDVESKTTIDAIENLSMDCRTTNSKFCDTYNSKDYNGYGILQNGGTIGAVKNVVIDCYYGGISGVRVVRSTGENNMDVDGMKVDLHDLYGVWLEVYGIANNGSTGSIKALNNVQITLTLHGSEKNRVVKFKGLFSGSSSKPVTVGENFSITVPTDASYPENITISSGGIYSKDAGKIIFPTPADSTTPQTLVKTIDGTNDVWKLGYPAREGDSCICEAGCTETKWHHYCPVCSDADGKRSANPCAALVQVSTWEQLCAEVEKGTTNISLTTGIEATGRSATVPNGATIVIKGLSTSGGDPTGDTSVPTITRKDSLNAPLFTFAGDDGSLTLNNVKLIGRESEEGSATEHAVIELQGANELTLGGYSSIWNSYGGAIRAGSVDKPFSGRITMKDDAVISGHQVTGKNGGAVYVYGSEDKTAEVTVRAITSCSASASVEGGGQGGAVWAKNAKVTVGGVNEDNGASKGGGFIYAEDCNVDFQSGSYTGKAKGNGGAAYIDGGTVTFTGTVGKSFKDSAAVNGAGLYLTGGVTVTLNTDDKVTFTGNTASGLGGGIYIDNAAVNITGATFTGNKATGADSKGGGIYLAKGEVDITGGAYTGNTADTGSVLYAAEGAAFSVTGGTMKNTGGANDNVNKNGTVAADKSIETITVGGSLDLPEPAAGNGHGIYLLENQKLTLQAFSGGKQIYFYVDTGTKSDIRVTTNKLTDNDTDVLKPESTITGLKMTPVDDTWHLVEPGIETDSERQRYSVRIGGDTVYYYDLSDAFAKLGRMDADSAVIKIMKGDDGADKKLTVNTVTTMSVPKGKTVTLDLNGFTIDATTSVSELITVEGALTVTDSTVSGAPDYTGNDKQRGAPEGAGTILLHDSGDNRRDLLHVSDNGKLTVEYVNLKVTKPAGIAKGVCILLGSRAELTLKNSTVEAPWYGVADIAEYPDTTSRYVNYNQGGVVKSIKNCVIIQTNATDSNVMDSGAALYVGLGKNRVGSGWEYKDPTCLGTLENTTFTSNIIGVHINCRFEEIKNCDITGGSSFGLWISRDENDTDKKASGDIVSTNVSLSSDGATALYIYKAVAMGALDHVTAKTSELTGGEALCINNTSVTKIVDSAFTGGAETYSAVEFTGAKIGDPKGAKETVDGFDIFTEDAIENVTVDAHGGIGIYTRAGTEIYGNVAGLDVVCDNTTTDFGYCISGLNDQTTNIHGIVKNCYFYTVGDVTVEVSGTWGGIEDCVIISDYHPDTGKEASGTAIHMADFGGSTGWKSLLIRGIKDSALSVRGIAAQKRNSGTPRPLDVRSASYEYTLDLDNVTFYIGTADAELQKVEDDSGKYTGAFVTNALHAHVGELTIQSVGGSDKHSDGRMSDQDGVVEIYELTEPGLIFPLDMTGKYVSATGGGDGIGKATNEYGRALTLRYMGSEPLTLNVPVTVTGGIENGELRLENFALTEAAPFAGKSAADDFSTVVTLGADSGAPSVKTDGSVRLTDNASVSGTVEAGEQIYVSGTAKANDIKLKADQTITLENGGLTGEAKITVTPAVWPTSGHPVQITTAETGTKLYETGIKYISSSDPKYTVVTNETGKYLELRLAYKVTVNSTEQDEKAVDGLDYTYTIPDYDANGIYTYSVTVGSETVEAAMKDGVITVPGEDVTGDIAITYEKKNGQKVTLTLDGNGGKFDGDETTTVEATIGSDYPELTTPTREGYAFAGWSTDAAGENRVDTDGKVTYVEPTTLYAQWTANQYDVTLYLNYDSEDESTTTGVKVTYGGTYTLPDPPARTGYTFRGWFTARDGGTRVNSGDKFDGAAGVSLYAHWTANQYTVTLYLNYTDDDSNTMTGTTVTYGGTYTLPDPPARTGYTFRGWFTARDGGAQVNSGDKFDGTADVSLYAHWLRGTITLTLDAGEGNFGEDENGDPVTEQEVKAEAGEAYDLPEPSRTGYTFEGWYTDPGDEDTRVEPDGTVVFAGDTTLHAKWTVNSYNAAFDLNYEGATNPTGAAVEYNSAFTAFPEVVSQRVAANGEKFRFDGWEYAATTALYKSGDSFIMPANDVEFVAKWTQIGQIDVEITNPDDRYVKIYIQGVNGESAAFEQVTGSAGASYTKEFTDLPYGVYNVVVEVSDNAAGENPIVNTFTVELAEPAFTLRVTLPEAYFNYSVATDVGAAADNLENTVDVALDDLKPRETDGQTEVKAVDVELTAKELSEDTIRADEDFDETTDTVESIKTEIDHAAADRNAGLIGEAFTKFVDVIVTQTETTYTKNTGGSWTADMENQTHEQLPETDDLITISFPVTRLGIRDAIARANEELLAENEGAEPVTLGNVIVYRMHGNQIEPLRKVSDAVGERAGFECYYVHTVTGSDGTQVDYITVKAQRFSVYAFGVSSKPVAEQNGAGGVSSFPVILPENVEHGSVTSDYRCAPSGVKVTLTVTPDQERTVESLTVTDSKGNELELTDNGDGTYSFTMPAGGVTVRAKFHECPSLRFPDLDVTKWYHLYTDYVIGHGIMNGCDTKLFVPHGSVTRAEMVMTLWNMAKNAKSDKALPYSDVAEGAWYYEAIRWATEAGVVDGYPDKTFRPDQAITREEMAAMLYRYEKNVLKGGFEAGWSYEMPFRDKDKVQDWALEAMSWCAGNSLFEGREQGLLKPQDKAERSELAKILTKYSQLGEDEE